MENEKLEFFKLDEIDRKVLLWLITHAPKWVKGWIEYAAEDYKRKKSIHIDVEKMYRETQDAEMNQEIHEP